MYVIGDEYVVITVISGFSGTLFTFKIYDTLKYIFS